MDELYASESLLQIVLVTGMIGGGAAFLAGRAIAQTWRPFWNVLLYMAMLGAGGAFRAFRAVRGDAAVARLLRSPTRFISSSSARWRGA